MKNVGVVLKKVTRPKVDKNETTCLVELQSSSLLLEHTVPSNTKGEPRNQSKLPIYYSVKTVEVIALIHVWPL